MEEAKIIPILQSLIVTIDGAKYDLTNFADTHPGGRSILERAAATTDAGQTFRNASHSETALRMKESYLVTTTNANDNNVEDGYTLPDDENNTKLTPFEVEKTTAAKNTTDSTTILYRMWTKQLTVLIASFIWALVTNLTSQSGAGWYSDWIRQYPYTGQSGYGRFEIRGASGKSMDYPWRLALPSKNGTILAWLLCVLHVLGQWTVLHLASQEKVRLLKDEGVPRYSNELNKWNYWMVGVNIAGIALGFVHKQIYYDGLVGTLSESVAQNAVVFYLSVVLLMETPRRGMFFHRGRGFFCFAQDVQTALSDFLKRYHGYLFSLAFTVNYHYQAIESTSSHFFGYFYQMLLIFQGTLLFNHSHKDRGWTFWLESLVLLHAIGVAAIQNIRSLCMFTFGFALMTMVTQIWGLPFVVKALFPPELEGKNTRANVIIPTIVGLLWLIPVITVSVWGIFPGFMAILIPVGLLTLYVVVALLFWLGYRLYTKFTCDGLAAQVFYVTYGVAATALAFIISVALVGGATPGLYKFATPKCGMVFFENGANTTLAPPDACFV